MSVVLTDRELRKAGLGHLCAKPAPDPKKKTPKYNNIKTEKDGLKFDSKKEQRRYEQLKTMQRIGLIADLQHHVRFEIIDSVQYPTKKSRTAARYYEADFVYTDLKTGQTIVEDVKCESTATNPVYTLKKQLMMLKHGIEIQEV